MSAFLDKNIADIILLSDCIFDSVSDQPFSGGIAIQGKRIIAVGEKNEIKKYIGADTEIRDFGDKTIMAGFIDGHAHFNGVAYKKFALVLNGLDELHSEEECARAVKEFADAHPELTRINSNSWILTSWGESPVPPTKASLDAVLPDKPVYLYGADGHTMWLNSAAIEECELEKEIEAHPEYPDEWASRDENGELTGVITEDYVHTIEELVDVHTPEETADFQDKTLKYFAEMGITGVTDVTPFRSREVTGAFSHLKELDNAGELTCRVYIWPGKAPKDDDTTSKQAEDILALVPYFNSDQLRITGIKTIYDGIPFSHTSAMLEPYTDRPDVYGAFLTAPEIYTRWVKEVNALGFSIKCHCTGDAAVHAALDNFEAAQKENPDISFRNTIEHMDQVIDSDVPRFAELGVIASVQPSHVNMCKGIGITRYGKRSDTEWRFRDLINANALLAIGTDGPVVDMNPYYTIYMAMTRRDLDGTYYSPNTLGQVLTLPEVLKGYTYGSAYNNFMEDKVGTIEAGKYADIIAMDRNIFTAPVEEIKNCRTICTIFGGKIIYEE